MLGRDPDAYPHSLHLSGNLRFELSSGVVLHATDVAWAAPTELTKPGLTALGIWLTAPLGELQKLAGVAPHFGPVFEASAGQSPAKSSILLAQAGPPLLAQLNAIAAARVHVSNHALLSDREWVKAAFGLEAYTPIGLQNAEIEGIEI